MWKSAAPAVPESAASRPRRATDVAYVGVGSNIDPEVHVPAALQDLAARLPLLGVSTFYRTPAIGATDAPDFYNGVVVVEALLEPSAIRRVLGQVEDARGRTRGADRFSSRVIDLDLLLVDGPDPPAAVLHSDVEERCFVALPLLELAPDLRLPDGRALADLATRFHTPVGLALPEFTRQLRHTLMGGA